MKMLDCPRKVVLLPSSYDRKLLSTYLEDWTQLGLYATVHKSSRSAAMLVTTKLGLCFSSGMCALGGLPVLPSAHMCCHSGNMRLFHHILNISCREISLVQTPWDFVQNTRDNIAVRCYVMYALALKISQNRKKAPNQRCKQKQNNARVRNFILPSFIKCSGSGKEGNDRTTPKQSTRRTTDAHEFYTQT